jgi:hypothetical protein
LHRCGIAAIVADMAPIAIVAKVFRALPLLSGALLLRPARS